LTVLNSAQTLSKMFLLYLPTEQAKCKNYLRNSLIFS
jgi:hypothetical protein